MLMLNKSNKDEMNSPRQWSQVIIPVLQCKNNIHTF